jgi:penicillin-binding protein 2
MIEKHIKGEITRTDLEDWLLRHSLQDEYAKPYSGEPFKINGYTTLQTIEEKEYQQLKKQLNNINKPDN